MFEIGLSDKPFGDNGNGSRASEQEESRRLIAIAKTTEVYYCPQSWTNFGDLHIKPSGESRIFVNEAMGLVFKVRDPFAKAPIKSIQPHEVIYEHLIHNLLFPSTRYNFVGISEEHEDVRIILSQEYVSGWCRPLQSLIDDHLASIGLFKENRFYYGNEFLAVTDVASESDNVLLDENGSLRFIDPLIRLRKPASDILNNYPLSVTNPQEAKPPRHSIFQRILRRR